MKLQHTAHSIISQINVTVPFLKRRNIVSLAFIKLREPFEQNSIPLTLFHLIKEQMDPSIDWQTSCHELKDRGEHLLKTGKWADCHFLVGAEPNQVMLPGHKLIMAMASPVRFTLESFRSFIF